MQWLRSTRARRPVSRRTPAVVDCLEERSLLSGASAALSAAASYRLALIQAANQRLARAPVLPRLDAGGKVVSNLIYTRLGGSPQGLDVYRPAGAPPAGGRPVILAIHGGGWRRFSKDDYGPVVASTFLAAGYDVVAPNYQLSAPGSPSFPTNVQQLQDAVRWVRQNASAYGFDPDRIVAMGESAGAHLAALLGTLPDRPGPVTGLSTNPARLRAISASSPRVQAVIDFYGPTDLSSLSPLAEIAARQMLGNQYAGPAGRALASPVRLVTSRSAPMLIVHGTQDWLIPQSQAEQLAATLTRAGVPNRLVLVPGASHGFGFRVGQIDLAAIMLDFLRATLKSPSAAP